MWMWMWMTTIHPLPQYGCRRPPRSPLHPRGGGGFSFHFTPEESLREITQAVRVRWGIAEREKLTHRAPFW